MQNDQLTAVVVGLAFNWSLIGYLDYVYIMSGCDQTLIIIDAGVRKV